MERDESHYLAKRGWTLKGRWSGKVGDSIYMGNWWHDLSGVPRLHEESFVCKVIEGKEDNAPRGKHGNSKTDG